MLPGLGIAEGGLPSAAAAARGKPLAALVVESFPASVFDTMAQGDMIQIILFCLLLGVAAAAVPKAAGPLLEFASSITAISFEFTRIVMWLAPAAIFAAIAQIVARSPRDVIASLGGFIAAAWSAQFVFLILVLGGSLLFARVPLRGFVRAVEEPFAVAFATTSSAAAMPKALDAMERLGLPRSVYAIVTPLSMFLKLMGSCTHLAMCIASAANASGIALSPGRQMMILLTLKLTSKGVAGIPRANFIILTAMFSSFGLPAEMLTVLLGIDALIDPVRTGVNVLSHCVASPVVARWAGTAASRE